jgi:16S rRNA (adenine1518-N6/adenine1519-N6)-dimethyltransferase
MILAGADVRRLLSEHHIRPSRALGQNFVVDPNTLRRIARLSGAGPGTRVVEIGAGVGSLTVALAETGASVRAIETDRRLVAVLRQVVEGTSTEVVEADALRAPWSVLLGQRGVACSLVANLPYNIATPLVVRTLEEASEVPSLLVMVQREVGERMAAGAGSAAYGAVSVKVTYWSQARLLGRVPPTVFYPRPKVESVLVRLDRRASPALDPTAVPYERLARVVAAGFGQRRKMLRRSLAGVVAPEAFSASGISGERRAEDLDVEAWGRLIVADAALDADRGER